MLMIDVIMKYNNQTELFPIKGAEEGLLPDLKGSHSPPNAA